MVKGEPQKKLNPNSLPSIFKLITEIEEKFDVDSIKLQDGTKLWNLIRIIIFFYFQKHEISNKRSHVLSKFNSFFNLAVETLKPLKFPKKNGGIYGFSGTEARKLKNGKYYDKNMDSLYEIFNNNLYVFEWPTPQGYRRKYNGKIYSKNYVPMHIPVYSKTFWNIAFYKLFGKKHFEIYNEDLIDEILNYVLTAYSTDKKRLEEYLYNNIAIFFYMKEFFTIFLKKYLPKAVLMRCGYGRFHMALSQACKELGIPSIELQHGLITRYHAGYIKTTKSENRDCVPEYILTYGDFFTDIIREGSLFEKEKVVTVGFPYLEEVMEAPPSIDEKVKEFISKFAATILVTSQWTVADELKEFIVRVAKELNNRNKSIGIVFKPHPRDWRDYSNIREENMFIPNKYDSIYEILKVVDIHSTVYSTSGLEALAFGKPNIFIDVGKTNIEDIIHVVDNKVSFLVSSPQEYIEKVEYIFSDYEKLSKEVKKVAEKFFKPNAKKNIETFLKSVGITQ